MKSTTSSFYTNYKSKQNLNNETVKKLFKERYCKFNRQKASGENYTPELKEKLICSSSYFTFGLTGLVFVFLNFINNESLSKFSSVHIVQSLFIGATILVSILALEGLAFVTEIVIFFLESYKALHTLIYGCYPLLIFGIVFVFAGICLSGKCIIIPGIRNVLKQIIKTN